MTLADDVKMLRNALGLNMRAFGKKLGVSAASVCLWESGKRNPRQSVLKLMDVIRHKMLD